MLPRSPVAPTARQAEYLAFIRAFTERWRVPPSFEDIGRHFMTTAPSVNSMIKTLESRGFLTRIPGQARTLRVIVPEGPDVGAKPRTGKTPRRDDDMKAAVHLACLVIERLVPALKSVTHQQLWSAFDAVSSAVEVVFLAAGASAKEKREAQATLRRAAMIAQGMSPETRPGRTMPWWRRER
jgi:SOS-response transcriptional repressor LexA